MPHVTRHNVPEVFLTCCLILAVIIITAKIMILPPQNVSLSNLF